MSTARHPRESHMSIGLLLESNLLRSGVITGGRTWACIASLIASNYPPIFRVEIFGGVTPGFRGSSGRGLRRSALRCRRLFARPPRPARPTWRDSHW